MVSDQWVVNFSNVTVSTSPTELLGSPRYINPAGLISLTDETLHSSDSAGYVSIHLSGLYNLQEGNPICVLVSGVDIYNSADDSYTNVFELNNGIFSGFYVGQSD